MTQPLFTVVIPACNRPDLLKLALESLRPDAQDLLPDSYEVIVSDDSSNDGVHQLIDQSFPWVSWLEGPRRGPAANRNHGASRACGEWLVFMDDDCIASSQLLRAYRSHLSQAMVLEGRTTPLGRRTRCDQECPVNETGGHLWSCNMAIQRQLFQQLHGFCEDYTGPAMEDCDFSYSLSKAGVPVIFVPEACVYHPWKTIKGYGVIALRAKATALYLSRHPELSSDYAICKQTATFLRVMKRAILDFIDYRGRGGLRNLGLRSWGAVLLMYYISVCERGSGVKGFRRKALS